MKLLLAVLVLPLILASGAPVSPGPSLSLPRAVHTATLLKSGKVLVAGGCTEDSCELSADGATTELYDPEQNRFERGPRMTRPRVGHTATRLPNGDVLVAGGWDGRRPTATAELYEAATGHFVAVGRMRAARGSPVAALLSGGRVLIAGGEGDGRPLRTAEIYDPRKRAFVSTRSMSTARGAHSAARLAGGNVLVVGGSDAKGRVLRSAEIFDPRKGRFTRVGPMTTPRYKQAVVALSGGGALVLGGSNALDFRGRYASAEIFSERTRTFRRVGRMANARFKLDASAVALRPGAVLVAGGGEQVEIFNTTRRVFGVIGGTGVRLAFATATRLPDGKVLFAGGYDDNIQVSRRAWLIQA